MDSEKLMRGKSSAYPMERVLFQLDMMWILFVELLFRNRKIWRYVDLSDDDDGDLAAVDTTRNVVEQTNVVVDSRRVNQHSENSILLTNVAASTCNSAFQIRLCNIAGFRQLLTIRGGDASCCFLCRPRPNQVLCSNRLTSLLLLQILASFRRLRL